MTAEIPKNGLFTDFYANAQMESKGNYKDGKKDGKWNTWFKNGNKRCKGEYIDGLEVGNWIWWNENGQKIFEGNHKDGIVVLNKLKDDEDAVKKAEELYAEKLNTTPEFIVAARAATDNNNKGIQEVIISDINMPFGSMVVFIIKWALASIPAFLILAILFLIFGGTIGTIATIFN